MSLDFSAKISTISHLMTISNGVASESSRCANNAFSHSVRQKSEFAIKLSRKFEMSSTPCKIIVKFLVLLRRKIDCNRVLAASSVVPWVTCFSLFKFCNQETCELSKQVHNVSFVQSFKKSVGIRTRFIRIAYKIDDNNSTNCQSFIRFLLC